jgi:hypothetical protein
MKTTQRKMKHHIIAREKFRRKKTSRNKNKDEDRAVILLSS